MRYSEIYDYGRMLDFTGLVVQQALIKYYNISKASILSGLFCLLLYACENSVIVVVVKN